MDLQCGIKNLVAYAYRTTLIEEEDITWALNTVALNLKVDEVTSTKDEVMEEAEKIPFDEVEAEEFKTTTETGIVDDGSYLENVLKVLNDYAVEQGLTDGDSVVYRDLFDTKLMGALTPRPSEVQANFFDLYEEDPKVATDWYYTFCRDTDYIRRYRVKKDLKWKTETEYGELDITINLSKPEKDPKAIAAAGKAKQTGYPKCQLCCECEGYAGRVDYPARENHRIIPIEIQGQEWGFQYSPYVYYNEHCIVLNTKHTPMKIDKSAFLKLFDFVRQFPHYFVGSNADLPIVGGSILAHEHFQGGNYEFAMAKAPVERSFTIPGYEDIKAGVVKWPMSVIRLTGENIAKMADLADHILVAWRGYTDEAAFIFAETDGVPHSTITPIARKVGEEYQLDLVLRNNITTEEHPLGVYHPHAKLHHIKKENIGLIEVMGLAVLPSRLKQEMAELKEAFLTGKDLRDIPELEKHADWFDAFMEEYYRRDIEVTAENFDEILQDEIGKVFMHVLEDAGVYKRTPEGQAAFDRFIKTL
ncbi:UTP-hexose-1-phosphate uridylyltransferase [Oribacterium sp. KHPX15]|uniref:UDP-glucose--hexose-1-phosphate uridylyltransferase n=1 Tax=Oribacterium sp. KHPX15 TaxID=1855342 RepID=UPI00089BA8B2|nr:UDP-glucose--hexose-1-phosphate uridylyltransferase [Oribacterium sp. KHPX15]SDZ92113.1 UTP-hexose-1-phosphate uridylyltransferase [Oribacterium sp. KHPX15]